MMKANFVCLLFLLNFSAVAQTNPASSTASVTNREVQGIELSEQFRATCIEGRRSICGKILKILPNGILVESGYTNLLRASLTKTSWLLPGAVVASRAPNLVESKEPGALCVGTVFLADLPRGKPQLYDYVIIAGYPEGEFTYTSVGTVQKTVRSFSASLDQAVKWHLAATQEQPVK
jgi:hypothetical protein